MNTLYYGDNLDILRRHISDNSVDLIYLDPPFNSKADYNILFKEPTGESSEAQITAFEDTWHWTEETERTFHEIAETAPANVVEMMRAFRQFVGSNDMMAYLTMMCIRLIELKRVLKDTGSIYLHCDPTASHYLKVLMDAIFGKTNFRNEIVWCYKLGGRPQKGFPKKHDIILFYSKSKNFNFFGDPIRIPYESDGGYISSGRKIVKGKVYEINPLGKIPEDWWFISALNRQEKERLGYPTQKPEALIERIIKASSQENDLILDPFCGCGSTIAVAQRLRRKWIGIDITHLAVNLIKWRMKHMFELNPKKDYKVIGEPEDLTGAMELASQNRFQFQWWVLSLIDARPYGDKKKGKDTGIDGFIYFTEDRGKIGKAIVSVKSGKTGVKDIRDLGHVLEREKAAMGLFVTLQPPTRDMAKEAAATGFYHSVILNKDFPKMQIMTIEELLNGRKPKIPYQFVSYKQAERVDTPEPRLL